MSDEFPGFSSVSLTIMKMANQPDKYKPLSLKPVELEVIHFKRTLFEIKANIEGIKSDLKGVLEFRGRVLTLTNKVGSSSRDVALALATDFFFRYRRNGLTLVEVRDDGRICEGSVENPEEFLGFLHFIKNRGGLVVAGDRLDGFALLKKKENEKFVSRAFE